jgi:hypothetical protein
MTDEYRIIFDLWRRERQRTDIQPLQEGFYSIMVAYSTQLREQGRISDKTTVKGKIIEKESEEDSRL